jgi:hypothetical protein
MYVKLETSEIYCIFSLRITIKYWPESNYNVQLVAVPNVPKKLFQGCITKNIDTYNFQMKCKVLEIGIP